MNKIEVPGKNIITEYPSCWDEHTEVQHLFILRQLLKLEDKKISMDEFKVIVLYNFLGFGAVELKTQKVREKYMSRAELEIKYENIWYLTETLDYFFRIQKNAKKDIPDKLVLDYSSVKNFIPFIIVSGHKLRGTDNAFQNMTFRELLDSLNFYNSYLRTRDLADLDKMIAVLYRPEIANYESEKKKPDFNGERRIKYNPNFIDKRAKLINNLPYYIKWGIFLHYKSCYDFITSGTVTINNNDIDLSILFKRLDSENGSVKGKGIGMIGLLFKLAETGIWGDIEKVAEANVYDVLLMLYQQKRDYDEQVRELKRKK